MSERNKEALSYWFEEVWNNKNESVITQMLTEESLHHGLGGPGAAPIVGVEGFLRFHRSFVEAFPDIRVTVEDMIAEGDKVAARCTVRGTHRGDGLGFAATNREFEFTGCGICRIVDGRFAEVWNEFDFLTLYSRLGMIEFSK